MVLSWLVLIMKSKFNVCVENISNNDILICPLCHEGHIVERISKKGRSKGKLFYACDRYPNCKTTYSSLDEINNTDTDK